MSRRSSWIPFTGQKAVYELMVNAPEVFTTGFLKNIKPPQWEDLCSSNEVEVVKIAYLSFKKFEDFEHFAKLAFYYEKEEVQKKRIDRLWKIILSLHVVNAF
jgi:hypothetical protein